MKITISVVAPFMLLSPVGSHRVILPCDSCNAITLRGVVQIEHPYGPFSMPNDRFNERVRDGSIHVQRA